MNSPDNIRFIDRQTTPLRHHIIGSATVRSLLGPFVALGVLSSVPTLAADKITGQVLGGGAPIVGSTVTLWAASAGAPGQLAQTRTGPDGRFELSADTKGAPLYLVAKGGRADDRG
jgi:hypothetical protein